MNTLSSNNHFHVPQPHHRSRSPQGVRFLHWWYQIFSPPEPEEDAPFQQRDVFRRGRTGSQISLFLFLLIFISSPAAFAGSNPLLITVLTLNVVLLALAMLLNRF